MKIPFSPPYIDDSVIAEVTDSLKSGWITTGPKVKALEAEIKSFTGTQQVLCVNSWTSGAIMMLRWLGVCADDEVIIPAYTYCATALAVLHAGAKIVMVDVNEDFDISVDAIRKAITPKTKAIIPVHLFGQCANMEAIMQLAKQNDIYVVEDAAQAIGSTYTFTNGNSMKAGTIGHFGCTSFFPSKNLGCFGDGGAVFTNDDALAQEVRSIANHGMKVRYHHDRIGVNSRLDTIQAAILRVKLKHLDTYNAARKLAAQRYDELLVSTPKLQIPSRVSWSDHTFHQYTLRLLEGDRHRLIENLKKLDIPAMVYYPVPLNKQLAFQPYVSGDSKSTYSNSLLLSQQVFSLPLHTELTQAVQQYIADNVIKSL